MVEALIGRGGRGIDAVAGCDRRDEDVGAAELEVDARLALLHAADDLSAEHALEPLRGRLRIRAAQVDVIPGVGRHVGFSCVSQQLPVGWVERSETHHASENRSMGFAALNPSYTLHQSAYCPASLMIGAQRSISLRSFARSASGVASPSRIGAVLISANRLPSSGSFSAACNARTSFCTVAAGVPAGA